MKSALFARFSPELKPVEKEIEVLIKFPEVEPLNPPVLTLNEIAFSYTNGKDIFNNVNLNANLDSRICIVSIYDEAMIIDGESTTK